MCAVGLLSGVAESVIGAHQTNENVGQLLMQLTVKNLSSVDNWKQYNQLSLPITDLVNLIAILY